MFLAVVKHEENCIFLTNSFHELLKNWILVTETMLCTVETSVFTSLWNTVVSHFSLSNSEELFQLLQMVPDLFLNPSLLPVWT